MSNERSLKHCFSKKCEEKPITKIYFHSDFNWVPSEWEWREMAKRMKIKGTKKVDKSTIITLITNGHLEYKRAFFR